MVTYEELRRGMITTKDPVRIQYNTKEQFMRTAKMLGLMDDFKVATSLGWTKPVPLPSVLHSPANRLFFLQFSHRAVFHELPIAESSHSSTTIRECIWRRTTTGKVTMSQTDNIGFGSGFRKRSR